MSPAQATGALPAHQAFTVLIPRGLQPAVDGLSAEARQSLFAELFRMASLAHEEHDSLPSPMPFTLRLEVAGCHASVELDPERSRLTLAGLTRLRP